MYCSLLTGLLLVFQPVCHAGSGSDKWGADTLVNLPPGKSRGTVPNQAGDNGDSAPIEVPCQCSDAGKKGYLALYFFKCRWYEL